MKQRLAMIALVVDDYDRAIAWYTGKLGFELLEDSPHARQVLSRDSAKRRSRHRAVAGQGGQ